MIIKTYCSKHKNPFAISFREINDSECEAFTCYKSPRIASWENCEIDSSDRIYKISEFYPGCAYCDSRGLFMCHDCNTLQCSNSFHEETDGISV